MQLLQTANSDAESCNASSSARFARHMATGSIVANVLLLCCKLVATILTGSLSIISALVDSCVDLTSGAVIYLTERAIRKRDPYKYPRGRTRLEPLALVIISVIMAVASVQVIVQSVEAIITTRVEPSVGWIPVALMAFTVMLKLVLFLICWRMGTDNPAVAVLAQDHRNDCISNTMAIVCSYLGEKIWIYADPIGAILISLYIAINWFITGYQQTTMLSGLSAKPQLINRIVKVALEHDNRIQKIDTVYAYHYGTQLLVELHVVVDPEMTHREVHDLSEPLQNKIEALPFVERAFVHVDYESCHHPSSEHRVV